MLKDIGFIVKTDIKSDPGNTTFYLFDLEVLSIKWYNAFERA